MLLVTESEAESEDGHVSEEEVTQTIIDEDGQEKTVTVMVQKPPKPKKRQSEPGENDSNEKNGEGKTKGKDKDKSKLKDKESSREKDAKSKRDKEGGEKEDNKKKKKEKGNASVYGESVYDKKEEKRKERKLTMDSLSETPELINVGRRLEAAENGIKSLRNIIDSMVNQVDFGDEVGGLLKAQLDQVQQQLNKVELVPEGDTAKKEKKRKGSKAKGAQDVPKEGIITEGCQGGVAIQGPGEVTNVIPVIPPLDRSPPKPQPGRLPSRKDERRKISLPMKGDRPPSQGDKVPLRKHSTIEDLKLRKKAREEGVTIEEIEAREAVRESKKEMKDKEKEKGKEDEKEKADKKKGEDSSSEDESMDSEEEREAMEEMIMGEIEAALENPADPEAQVYALRLSIEQMNNMKRSFTQSQEEFKREMEKNKRAIDLIAKDLAAFRSARKAQVG